MKKKLFYLSLSLMFFTFDIKHIKASQENRTSSPSKIVAIIMGSLTAGGAITFLIAYIADAMIKKNKLTSEDKKIVQEIIEKIPQKDLKQEQEELFEKIDRAVELDDYKTLKELSDNFRAPLAPEEEVKVNAMLEKINRGVNSVFPEEKDLFEKAVSPVLDHRKKVAEENKKNEIERQFKEVKKILDQYPLEALFSDKLSGAGIFDIDNETPLQEKLLKEINTALEDNDFKALKEILDTYNDDFSPNYQTFSQQNKQKIEEIFQKKEKQEELSPEEESLLNTTLQPLRAIDQVYSDNQFAFVNKLKEFNKAQKATVDKTKVDNRNSNMKAVLESSQKAKQEAEANGFHARKISFNSDESDDQSGEEAVEG